MNKKLYLTPMVGFLVLISILGCGSTSSAPSSQPVGADIIQKYNFHVEGQSITTPFTLPQPITDAGWGLKEDMCQQAGYDLTPYAGQNISVIQYNLAEKYYYPAILGSAGESLYLWVIAKDQTSICGYLSVREDSGLIPGVFAVNDPNIKAPSVMLTQNATGSTVSLVPGQIVTVSLPGSGSTGYTWEVVPGIESILLKQGDPQFVPDSNAVGSAGVYTFTFEAIAAGTGSLNLIYHRPWETDVAPLQTFQVSVVVAN
jgi:inhibitor of cysteine peptidase